MVMVVMMLMMMKRLQPGAEVSLVKLDLGSLASVAEAAAEVGRRGVLHVLVANAGVVNPPHRVTDDGFEATWQVLVLPLAPIGLILESRCR